MQLVLDFEHKHGRSAALRRLYNQSLRSVLRGGGKGGTHPSQAFLSSNHVTAEYVNSNKTIQGLVNKAMGSPDGADVTQTDLDQLQKNNTIKAAILALRELLDNGQPGWSQC